MSVDRNELLNAMRLIKKMCVTDHRENCYRCPLYMNEVGCYVQAFTPVDWNIKKDDTEQTWRAYI